MMFAAKMNSYMSKPMSADAWFAPADQSARMTESCALILDTAVLAVSFLLAVGLVLVSGIVRIIVPTPANPYT